MTKTTEIVVTVAMCAIIAVVGIFAIAGILHISEEIAYLQRVEAIHNAVTNIPNIDKNEPVQYSYVVIEKIER